MLRPSPIIDVPQPNPALNRDVAKHPTLSLHHELRALLPRQGVERHEMFFPACRVDRP